MAKVVDLWHDRNREHTKLFGIGKRWQAVWYENGSRLKRSFSSKDAAEAHLTRIDHEQRAGDYISERENVIMSDYWPMFRRQKAGCSRSTLDMYKGVWSAHIRTNLGRCPDKKFTAFRGAKLA